MKISDIKVLTEISCASVDENIEVLISLRQSGFRYHSGYTFTGYPSQPNILIHPIEKWWIDVAAFSDELGHTAYPMLTASTFIASNPLA